MFNFCHFKALAYTNVDVQYFYVIFYLIASSATLQLAASTSSLKHQKTITEMLLLAGALPNFCSSLFSYVGPSLSALVEYLTYCDNYDYTLVRLLLQYGARVSFRLPTRLLKIRHPAGILSQVLYYYSHCCCLCCCYYYYCSTGLDCPLCHCAVAQGAPVSTNTGAPWPLRFFFDNSGNNFS